MVNLDPQNLAILENLKILHLTCIPMMVNGKELGLRRGLKKKVIRNELSDSGTRRFL